MNENTELKKKLEKLETRQLADIKNVLVKKAESVNGSIFIGKIIEVSDPDALKKLCFDLKNEIPNSTIVLAASIDSKAYVTIMLDEKLATEKNLDASRIIREEIAPLIKGGGGGQKTLASAGGQDTSKLEQVIQKVKSFL
jgi:alanyl-tRNA synthetase